MSVYTFGAAGSTSSILGTPQFPGTTAKGTAYVDGSNNLTTVALSNGQVLIGSTGNVPSAGTLTSTAHQTTVTNGAGTITVGTVQNIDTTSTPTFGAETLTNASNQFIIQPGAAGNSFTFTCTNPAANRTITWPDPGNNANVVLTQGTQTIAGQTTFSSSIVATAASNQLILLPNGAGHTEFIITCTNPAATRTYTIQDAGTSANFILSQGTQTIGGAMTFTNSLASNSYTLFNSTIVLTGTASVSANTVTAGGGTTFVASLVGCIIVFSGGLVGFILQVNSSTTLTIAQSLSSGTVAINIFGNGVQIDNSGDLGITGAGNLLVTSVAPSSAIYLDASSTLQSFQLTNGQLLIGSSGANPVAANISAVANQTTVTNSAGGITIGTAQSISPSSTPTFSSETLTAASNQLTFQPGGSGNTIAFNCTNPAANRTYTLPDGGANANVVLTQGTQTLAGATTFSGATTISNLNYLLSGSVTNTTGTASASSGAVTGTSTAFVTTMTGGIMVFANGIFGFITAVSSATSLTLTPPSITVSSQTFTIYYNSLQIDNRGNIGMGQNIIASNLAPNGVTFLDGSKVLNAVALTSGQLLIGSTGNNPVAALLTGTTNQVLVAPGAGSITLSLPQSIATSSTPQFQAIGISTAPAAVYGIYLKPQTTGEGVMQIWSNNNNAAEWEMVFGTDHTTLQIRPAGGSPSLGFDKASGNLSIQSTNVPAYALDVNGAIRLSVASPQVILQTSQSDFTYFAFGSSAQPNTNTTLNLYDPGTSSCYNLAGIPPVVQLATSGTVTVTVSQSGTIFYVRTNTAAVTVNLPALPPAGCTYKFIVGSIPSGSFTYTIKAGGTDKLNGSLIANTAFPQNRVILSFPASSNFIQLFPTSNALVSDWATFTWNPVSSAWDVFAVSSDPGQVTTGWTFST